MSKVKRVLFVTNTTKGAPARYRVQALGTGLLRLKVEAAVISPNSSNLLVELNKASHVILFRTWATKKLINSLLKAQENNPRLIIGFDVDDPLWLPFDTQTEEELQTTEAMQTLMRGCDFMLGSTKEICEQGSTFADMPGFHTPNSFHPKALENSQRALKIPRIPGPPRIAFQSGSGTHNEHWNQAEESVIKYMNSNRKATLFMFGITPWNQDLEKLRDRVIQVPWMDWNDLPYWINQMDVVLSPVGGKKWVADTKSSIKWLEAALVKTPTIASATEPFRDAIEHGVNGFLCKEKECTWDILIESSLNSSTNRTIGQEAYNTAIKKFSAKKSAETLLTGLEEIKPLRRLKKLSGVLGPEKNIDEVLSLTPTREKDPLPKSLQAKLFIKSYKGLIN